NRMRYRLTLEYDGTPFAGWQRQSSARSIQEAVERAIFAFTAEEVTVTAAGRTDTGVHARGQVISFDLVKVFSPETVRDAMNAHLRPDPVVVVEAHEAPPDFSARFNAIKRHYEYRVLCRKAPPALDRNRVWWLAQPLDCLAMQEAAQSLIGKH